MLFFFVYTTSSCTVATLYAVILKIVKTHTITEMQHFHFKEIFAQTISVLVVTVS